MRKIVDNIINEMIERMSGQPNSLYATGDEVRLAACICEIERLHRVISEVHSWVVCAAITTPEDMAQNFTRIEQITNPEYDD